MTRPFLPADLYTDNPAVGSLNVILRVLLSTPNIFAFKYAYMVYDLKVHGDLVDYLTDEFRVWRFAPLSIRLSIEES
ncbi:MAG: hypothetical protein ACJAYE_002469 [Candidatus Azotimanducaceae bacterium]|jgi:hypothetical protein